MISSIPLIVIIAIFYVMLFKSDNGNETVDQWIPYVAGAGFLMCIFTLIEIGLALCGYTIGIWQKPI